MQQKFVTSLHHLSSSLSHSFSILSQSRACSLSQFSHPTSLINRLSLRLYTSEPSEDPSLPSPSSSRRLTKKQRLSEVYQRRKSPSSSKHKQFEEKIAPEDDFEESPDYEDDAPPSKYSKRNVSIPHSSSSASSSLLSASREQTRQQFLCVRIPQLVELGLYEEAVQCVDELLDITSSSLATTSSYSHEDEEEDESTSKILASSNSNYKPAAGTLTLDLELCNAALKAFAMTRRLPDAFDLYRRMNLALIEPDTSTIEYLMLACANAMEPEFSIDLFSQTPKELVSLQSLEHMATAAERAQDTDSFDQIVSITKTHLEIRNSTLLFKKNAHFLKCAVSLKTSSNQPSSALDFFFTHATANSMRDVSIKAAISAIARLDSTTKKLEAITALYTCVKTERKCFEALEAPVFEDLLSLASTIAESTLAWTIYKDMRGVRHIIPSPRAARIMCRAHYLATTTSASENDMMNTMIEDVKNCVGVSEYAQMEDEIRQEKALSSELEEAEEQVVALAEAGHKPQYPKKISERKARVWKKKTTTFTARSPYSEYYDS